MTEEKEICIKCRSEREFFDAQYYVFGLGFDWWSAKGMPDKWKHNLMTIVENFVGNFHKTSDIERIFLCLDVSDKTLNSSVEYYFYPQDEKIKSITLKEFQKYNHERYEGRKKNLFKM